MIALKMVNCPICNEPATVTHIRIDYLGSAHPITNKCQKQVHAGPEYIDLDINHKHTEWCISQDGLPIMEKTEGTFQNIEVNSEETT